MSDWEYDEHICLTQKQKHTRLNMCEHGLWPHENCKKCLAKAAEAKLETLEAIATEVAIFLQRQQAGQYANELAAQLWAAIDGRPITGE